MNTRGTNTHSTLALALAGADESADLAAYLERLLRYDRAAAVRVVVSGDTVGVYGQPPFHVLTLRTWRLAETAGVAAAADAALTAALDAVSDTPSADVTVSAGQLLDAATEPGPIVVPPALTGATAWTGFLPPRRGWERLGTLPVAEVEMAAMAGIAEFKQRAEAMPDTARTRSAVDTLAAEIWDRPLSFGLPVRAAHAARAMAFLGAGQAAAAWVSRAGRWLRLDAPFGTVVVRDSTLGF
jgi:hypothetical protein